MLRLAGMPLWCAKGKSHRDFQPTRVTHTATFQWPAQMLTSADDMLVSDSMSKPFCSSAELLESALFNV